MKFIFVFCWWLLKISFISTESNVTETSEWRRTKSLLKSYILSQSSDHRKFCPAAHKELLNMTFSFMTYKVISCDEVQQSLTTVNYLEVEWYDPDIAWEPLNYKGMEFAYLPLDEFWHPDIFVTNSADHELIKVQTQNGHLQLTSKGQMTLRTPLILKTTCSMNLTWYPFDLQKCEINLLPFIDDCYINISTLQLSYPNPFHLTGEWEIVDRDVAPERYDIAGNVSLPIVRVKLTLARSPLFYVVTVIAPLMLTTFMTAFVFLMPPNSGERVSFLLSIFVSDAVFMNFIAGTIPRSMTLSSFPRLTQFLIAVMIDNFLALLATLFVIRKYNIEKREKARKSLQDLLSIIQDVTKAEHNCNPVQVTKLEKPNPDEKMPEFRASFKNDHSTLDSTKMIMGILLQNTQMNIKKLNHILSHPKIIRKSRGCVCCPRARTLDIIFFVFSILITAICDCMIIFLPDSSGSSWSRIK